MHSLIVKRGILSSYLIFEYRSCADAKITSDVSSSTIHADVSCPKQLIPKTQFLIIY